MTPPNNKKYKLVIILAFNLDLYTTILCNISIITNENKETFVTLFDYLKEHYQFNPEKITIDYSVSELNAIKHAFPNSIIIPCFFHLMQNLSKRLPDLKSKIKSKKQTCKNLLVNIKLMCFIPINQIDNLKKN